MDEEDEEEKKAKNELMKTPNNTSVNSNISHRVGPQESHPPCDLVHPYPLNEALSQSQDHKHG